MGVGVEAPEEYLLTLWPSMGVGTGLRRNFSDSGALSRSISMDGPAQYVPKKWAVGCRIAGIFRNNVYICSICKG